MIHVLRSCPSPLTSYLLIIVGSSRVSHHVIHSGGVLQTAITTARRQSDSFCESIRVIKNAVKNMGDGGNVIDVGGTDKMNFKKAGHSGHHPSNAVGDGGNVDAFGRRR